MSAMRRLDHKSRYDFFIHTGLSPVLTSQKVSENRFNGLHIVDSLDDSLSARSPRQHKAWGGVTVKRNPRSEPIKNDEPAAAGDSRCDYQDAHFRSAVARSAGLINSH